MALFSTIRSTERSRPRRNRSIEDPRSPQAAHAEHVKADFSLPRHLLISLAGITADVTSLQQRCDDDAQVQVALGTILGRLDYLVDSIYQQAAAHPAAPNVHPAGLTAASPSEVFASMPVDLADADTVARPLNGVARPLPGPHS
jgi:hypothetical protein